MVAPGYGNGFRITKKQIVYVPWNENEGLAFPGLDVDQWGNVFPVRAHGLNANDNGTLIVPGSPGSIPFLEDSGWGCWTTLAESDQECAALNTWFGHTPNYTSHAWEFWFTEWAGSDVFISAETFDAKGAKQLLKLKYTNPGGWNSVHNVSQAQPLYFTGHSSRTSSWGFVDAGTAHLGVTGIVSLTVDLNTLKLTGATVPP
jgi:hypothetical protein